MPYIFSQSPAIKKSKEVQKILQSIVEARGVKVLHVSANGYKFDSAFWIAVTTDAERGGLLADSALLKTLNDVFKETGFLAIIETIWKKELNLPQLAHLKTPSIAIESQETVDREFGGNWFHAMK